MGWILLGWGLVVVCVALPAWALAAADLNDVAGWANILALPVSVLGLVLVLAERNRARVIRHPPDSRRRPWMAPPLDRMVERPELAGRLMAELVVPALAEVGLTTALEGVGGFGKTRLATWVCHQPAIRQRFSGGLLWVTVGQEVHGADLAVRINDLAYALSGQRATISDPNTAGAELGRLLDEREPVLLVIDDVWDNIQLKPFRVGGSSCTRLVTTRIPDLLSVHAPSIRVDAMSSDQAHQLVADGVDGLPAEMANRLANLAGRWPVLLNLVNGVLHRRVARGQRAEDAAREIVQLLIAEGPVALDPARPADRDRAVAATVEASIALLNPAEQQRFLDLAIFPEDVDVPLEVLGLLWPDCRVDALCEELVGLGLVADHRLDPPGPRLVLHDVMRAYLRTRRNAADRSQAHQRLITAAAEPLADSHEHMAAAWWRLPPDANYLWRYLPYHLREAGQTSELAALTCDLRWVEAKAQRFGSVVPVEADLDMVRTSTARVLRRALQQTAHVLGPIDPPTALGATLASRLHGVPELETVLDRYLATLPTPRLQPAWPLPDRPDNIQPARVAGHTGGVTSCAFSADGTLLVTTSDDGTARIWRVADHTTQTVLSGHTKGVWDSAFSPDGTVVATTSDDNTARLWHTSSGAEIAVLRGHTDWVTACEFSPNGALLATASHDQTARLWDVATGANHAVLAGHSDVVNDCAFSPDGTLLATASNDGTVRLWRMPDGAESSALPSRSIVGGPWRCAFSPDGTRLAIAGEDGTVRLRRLTDGVEETVLSVHTERIWGCALSPDGTLLATASYGPVRLWEIPSGTQTAVLTGHATWVWACAFSPDGTLLATTGNDQTARLWRVADGAEQAVLAGRIRKMNSCAFSPDGTLLATAGEDGTAQLWRVADGGKQTTLIGHHGRVNHCAFAPNGTLLATAGNDQSVRLWNVSDGTPEAVLDLHTDNVSGCGFSPDGTLLAAAGSDYSVQLWNIANRSPQRTLTGHSRRVKSFAFSPDGALLATASNDHSVRLWNVSDGTTAAVLNGHTDIVNGCAFSPDGTVLATASDDRTVRLWQIANGAEVTILLGHTSWVERCAFSPDGTLLATAGNDGTVRLWQIASGRCHCALRVDGPVGAIDWHPNATMLCTVGGAGIYLLSYQP